MMKILLKGSVLEIYVISAQSKSLWMKSLGRRQLARLSAKQAALSLKSLFSPAFSH